MEDAACNGYNEGDWIGDCRSLFQCLRHPHEVRERREGGCRAAPKGRRRSVTVPPSTRAASASYGLGFVLGPATGRRAEKKKVSEFVRAEKLRSLNFHPDFTPLTRNALSQILHSCFASTPPPYPSQWSRRSTSLTTRSVRARFLYCFPSLFPVPPSMAVAIRPRFSTRASASLCSFRLLSR